MQSSTGATMQCSMLPLIDEGVVLTYSRVHYIPYCCNLLMSLDFNPRKALSYVSA